MGKPSTRLPSFCLNRIATRVRVRSPPLDSKPDSTGVETPPPPCNAVKETSSNGEKKEKEKEKEKEVESVGRKVMVVVDSSQEAKTALQWALSHSLQSNDTITLLGIIKPCKNGEQPRKDGDRDPKEYQLLNAMKSICQAKRPEVHVEISLVEGKERGPTIVEEARKQGASLLVMGQKKRSITWRLLLMWIGNNNLVGGGGGGGGGGGVADYCVQNATCMALAVRRKSRRGGGYVITTKRHRDFWLLA